MSPQRDFGRGFEVESLGLSAIAHRAGTPETPGSLHGRKVHPEHSPNRRAPFAKDLQILAEALPKIDPTRLLTEARAPHRRSSCRCAGHVQAGPGACLGILTR